MNVLPQIRPINFQQLTIGQNVLFISCEGFEERSLFFPSKIGPQILFSKSLVITYLPEKKSRLQELLPLVEKHSKCAPQIISFHRFEPQDFENSLLSNRESILAGIDEIVIDISVMSKLMIIIVILWLSNFKGRLRIIYSEPCEYAPSLDQFEKYKTDSTEQGWLPSHGVHDVVRTTLTSSIIMQSAPSIVIAFASFNEQLLRALLSVINPSHFFLLNGVPPHLKWRELATQFVNSAITKEYPIENTVDDNGAMTNRVSTLFYEETFAFLAKLYVKYCYSYRLIIAPTGSKLQALSCALFKICCPDVHIEYPTPESLNFSGGYSSPEIKETHEIVFDNLSDILNIASANYKLNG
jgi:hypothetical protein